nr:hypothetical protein [Cressdnaviricota sp.]
MLYARQDEFGANSHPPIIVRKLQDSIYYVINLVIFIVPFFQFNYLYNTILHYKQMIHQLIKLYHLQNK